jgi:peptidyl-prolyl cis-trans isomerase SurA
MNEDFRKIVQPLKEKDVTDPIAIPGGIQILSLRDKRRVLTGDPDDTVVELQQILLPVRSGASVEDTNVQLNLAQILSDTVSGCADHLHAAAESGSVGTTKLGNLRLRDLSGKISATVADLPVGKASAPIRIDQGVAVIMVCSRKEPEGSLPTRDQIADRLRQERVGVMARQYLRDLRAAAIVDLRV